MKFFKSASVVALILLSSADSLPAQSEPATRAARTWTDDTGKFSTKARLLEISENNVILENAEGIKLTVPIKALSQADQTFLRSLKNPFAVPAKDLLASISQAGVLVQLGNKGEVVAVPGMLMAKSNGKAVVLVERQPFVVDSDPPTIVRLKDDGTVIAQRKANSRVSLSNEFFSFVVDSVGYSAAALDLPEGKVTENMFVRVTGLISNDNGQTFKRQVARGVVKTILRDHNQEVRSFQIHGAGFSRYFAAIVSSDNGEFLGATRHIDSLPDGPPNADTLEVIRPGILNQMLQPAFTRMSTKVPVMNPTSGWYEFPITAEYRDPLELASDVRLLAFQAHEGRANMIGAYGEKPYTLQKLGAQKPNTIVGIIAVPREVFKGRQYYLQFANVSGGQIAYSAARRMTLPDRWLPEIEGDKETPTARPPMAAQQPRPAPRMASIPTPDVTAKDVAGPEYRLNGLKTRALQFKKHEFEGTPVWSPTGDAFYMVTEEQIQKGNAISKVTVIRRIAFPDFRQTHELKLDSWCYDVARSKSHVVAITKAGILMLNPDTLVAESSIANVTGTKIAASPALDLAFVPMTRQIVVVDTAQGRIVDQTEFRNDRRRGEVAPTPDGKYLFAMNGDKIMRYRVTGNQIKLEQTSAGLGSNPQGLCVFSDSKHVALPCGGGNRGEYP